MDVDYCRWIRSGLAGAVVLGGLQLQAATVKVAAVEPPSKLQDLQRKARESDRYRAQCAELQKTLDEMLALLPAEPSEEEPEGATQAKPGIGRLSKLIDKAAAADALARELEEVRVELDRTLMQRDALKADVTLLREEKQEVVDSLAELTQMQGDWETKMDGLKETIERLLLGEFEYYEVKAGDSLQSIASDPMVYGDPQRSIWLRQVNEGRIKHIENLRPGEVLVVPRFPRNGSYEF